MFDKEDQTETEDLTVEAEAPEPELEEETEAAQADAEEEVDVDAEEQEPDEAEAFTVSFGDDESEDDEEEAAKAPEWAREVRQSNRKLKKEKKELEARLKELEGAKEVETLGPKPTLESCEYDEGRVETALEAWKEQKAQADAQKRSEAEAQEAEARAWQERLDGYNDGKAALAAKARDFNEAEDELKDAFSPLQQGALLHVAKDAPLLVYALGKNPKKAQELAAIKDQALFIAELVRLETTMKASSVKKAPKPEKRVAGGGVPTSADQQLARLEAEADRTGDRTKVIQFKQRLKQKKG